MNVTNHDIIKFYANKPSYSDKYECMNAYRDMRIRCEMCGKTIQPANKTYNVFKSLYKKINVKSKNDSMFYEYICNESNRKQMKTFLELNPDEAVEMIHCIGKYNEKWHLLIAYYALSEYDKETKIYSLPELILDGKHVVTDWNLKGTRKSIKDPLVLLWMTEAAGVDIPYEIKNYIIEIQKELCSHATKEDDKNLINMFTCELWKEVASRIKEK